MTPRSKRIAAFLTIAALLQVSPFLVQVCGIRGVPMVLGWRMYERRGADVCDVRLRERRSDGTLVPHTPVHSPRKNYRTVEQADALGNAVCKHASGRDLRMTVRCGHWYRGWDVVRDGSEPLCKGAP